jgi:hypothetical protein
MSYHDSVHIFSHDVILFQEYCPSASRSFILYSGTLIRPPISANVSCILLCVFLIEKYTGKIHRKFSYFCVGSKNTYLMAESDEKTIKGIRKFSYLTQHCIYIACRYLNICRSVIVKILFYKATLNVLNNKPNFTDISKTKTICYFRKKNNIN